MATSFRNTEKVRERKAKKGNLVGQRTVGLGEEDEHKPGRWTSLPSLPGSLFFMACISDHASSLHMVLRGAPEGLQWGAGGYRGENFSGLSSSPTPSPFYTKRSKVKQQPNQNLKHC